MSGGSGTTWLSLVEEKRSSLNDLGCEALSICSEADFRRAFEDLCRRRKEKWATRLLSNLSRTDVHITAAASAVDDAAQLEASQGLTALLWWASFAAIECGSEAGAKLDDSDGLIHLLADLNCSVPHLGANVPRFPNEPTVQTPLQDLFGAYIDSLIFMVSYFRERPSSTAADLDPIRRHVEEVATKFRNAKSTYEEMLDKAQQREIILLQQSPRRASALVNGVYDDNHPDDSRARFRFRRRLGRGSFGEVSEVQEMSTEAVYARKLIHFTEGSSKAATIKKVVMNEVAIMQKLRHQHIASVLFYIKEPSAYSILMLPVADRDLLAFLEICINQDYPVSLTRQIYPWFGCLLDALAYAHKLGISHRDIKPSNILIKDGQTYLADFGVARDFTEQEASGSGDYLVRGTPVYRAPETRPDNPRGPAADIFALGCVFSEMLTVRKSRSLEDFRRWRQAPGELEGAFAFRANLPKVREWICNLEADALSEQLVDRIPSMLAEDPEHRPTAQEVVNSLKAERAFFCPSH